MKMRMCGLGSTLLVALVSLLIGTSVWAEDGDHLWTFDPGLPSASGDAFTEPAIGADGTIYVGHNPSNSAGSGMFYAINPDGTLRWSKNFPFHETWEDQTMGFRVPSIDPAGNVYFSAGRNLYSYSADGIENWKRALPLSPFRNYAPYVYPIAISEDGRLYMPLDDSALHELDPADGSTLWTFDSNEEHSFVFTRPVTVTLNGDLLLPFWDEDFYHLTKDGAIFAKQYTGDEDPSGDLCMSVSASGKMYATQGRTQREQTLRIYDGLGERPTNISTLKGVTVPPLIGAEGQLYFPDRYGKMYCLGVNQQRLWTLTGYADQGPILAEDGTLFAVTNDPAAPVIRALSPSGQTLYDIAGTISDPGAVNPAYQYLHSSAPPTVRLALQRDGTLIAAANNGKIYAFDGSSPLAKSDWPKVYGGYANASRLTHLAPEITEQPDGGTVVSGDPNFLEIDFIGRPAPSVQWYRNGVPVGSGVPRLSLSGLGGEAGEYHAVVENSVGSAQTETVTVVARHRLTVSAGIGGSPEVVPPGPIYDDGEVVTITAIEAVGYEFGSWIEEGGVIGDSGVLSVTMNRSRHIAATFDDVQAPSLEIDGEFPAVVSDQPSITITGQVGDNAVIASLTISVNGGQLQNVPLGGDSMFSISPDLVLGENSIVLVVEDNSGLVTDQNLSVEWRPERLWSFDAPSSAGEARVIEADVVLTSPGDVAGANLTISADSTYLEFLSFIPSLELFGMFQTQTEENGVLSFTFASLGNTLRSGSRKIGTLRYRVRSLPEALSQTIFLTEIDMADANGSPIAGVRSIQNAVIDLAPRAIVGDVNNNGRYDAGDAQHLQRLLGGLSEFRAWDHALNDINLSGGLDIGDVIIVLRTAVGLVPQPGDDQRRRNRAVRVGSAFDPTAPTARVVLDKRTATVGEKVKAQVWIENVPGVFGGTSYVLDYPVDALRLDDSSAFSSSPLQPASTLQLWNLAPSQNDFANQSGSITFVAGSAESWPGSEAGGLIAEFTFTVQAGAMTAAAWPIELREMEIATDEGLTVLRSNTISTDFLGQALSSGDWRSMNFEVEELADIAISGWMADPDKDGRSNLGEYFAGSGPKVADGEPIACPVLVETPNGETYPGLQFDFDPRAVDVTVTMELSSDLQSWLDGAGSTHEIETTSDPGPGLRRRILIDVLPMADEESDRFLRLKLSLEPGR